MDQISPYAKSFSSGINNSQKKFDPKASKNVGKKIEVMKSWKNGMLSSSQKPSGWKGNVAPKIGPMTFDWCCHILYYATLHNQYCNSQKYQSYSLTNGGAQDVDWRSQDRQGTVWHSKAHRVTDERIMGQEKNTLCILVGANVKRLNVYFCVLQEWLM